MPTFSGVSIILAIFGLVFGSGWALPAFLLAWAKAKWFPRSGGFGLDLGLLFDWMVYQTIMGWLTFVGFIVAFAIGDLNVVSHIALAYVLVAAVCGLCAWTIVTKQR